MKLVQDSAMGIPLIALGFPLEYKKTYSLNHEGGNSLIAQLEDPVVKNPAIWFTFIIGETAAGREKSFGTTGKRKKINNISAVF